MSFDSSYKVLPFTEADIEESLSLGEQAFADDPLTKALLGMLESDESRASMRESRRKRVAAFLQGERYGEQTTLFRPHYAKVVYAPEGVSEGAGKMVGAVGWHAPSLADSPEEIRHFSTDTKPAPDVQRMIDTYQEIEKIIIPKSDEMMGPERNRKYWYLKSLYTDPEHQRKGIGSRLVQWGVDGARADAATRPEQIKGVWTIATPAGLKTYLNAGMKEVGDVSVDYGKGLGENGEKFVWLRLDFDEEKSVVDGQA